MSDSHAALLLVAVHLPQLVPGFGTVLLKMSRPDPSAGFFLIRLAGQIFRLIFGLTEFLLQLQNAAENTAERYKFG